MLLKPRGLQYPGNLAAFSGERLSDLRAIVLLALVGLAAYTLARPLVGIAAFAVLVGPVVLTNAAISQRLRARGTVSPWPRRGTHNALAILQEARRCQAPALLATTAVISVAASTAEARAFHLVLCWMGARRR